MNNIEQAISFARQEYTRQGLEALYQEGFEAAFGKTQGTDYEFTKEDIDKIKAYVDANGIGTTRSDAALDNFYSQFVAPAKVN